LAGLRQNRDEEGKCLGKKNGRYPSILQPERKKREGKFLRISRRRQKRGMAEEGVGGGVWRNLFPALCPKKGGRKERNVNWNHEKGRWGLPKGGEKKLPFLWSGRRGKKKKQQKSLIRK